MSNKTYKRIQSVTLPVAGLLMLVGTIALAFV